MRIRRPQSHGPDFQTFPRFLLRWRPNRDQTSKCSDSWSDRADLPQLFPDKLKIIATPPWPVSRLLPDWCSDPPTRDHWQPVDQWPHFPDRSPDKFHLRIRASRPRSTPPRLTIRQLQTPGQQKFFQTIYIRVRVYSPLQTTSFLEIRLGPRLGVQ